MQDVTLSIKENYEKNIAYLMEFQPSLFEKIVSFESAIDRGFYKPRYELIYEGGYFDVLEITSQKKLYNTNGIAYATVCANSIDFSKDSSAFATFKQYNINENIIKQCKKHTILSSALCGYGDILHYISRYQNPSNPMKKLEKFIFFGTGLGGHIVEIDKKISATSYFIIEDDLELFRLSLLVTPYYSLAKKSTLYFSVFDEEGEFFTKAHIFLHNQFYLNHYIKFFHMLSHSEEKLKEFHIVVASQSHILFQYNSILEQFLRPLNYIKNGYKFVNILHKHFYEASLKKPFLLVAAGPSLEKNITWLKQNQDNFIIIAVSATLATLEKEQIKADIITNIDGFSEAIAHFDRVQNISFFSKSLFLISARTRSEIVDMLDSSRVFMFENNTSYKISQGNIVAPCVGSTTFLLTVAFGVKTLYLLGLDLAIDTKSGATHVSEHVCTKNIDIDNSLSIKQDMLSYGESLVQIEANIGDSVYTTLEYKASINSINSVTTSLKDPSVEIYNIDEGAKFKNTYPILAKDIELENKYISKEPTIEDILNSFNATSSRFFSKDELEQLQKRLSYAIELKSAIVEFGNLKTIKKDEFLDSITALISTLYRCDISAIHYDIALIFQEYFKLSITYVYDFFNTNEEMDMHIDSIKNMLIKHLLDIINTYINNLKDIDE